MEKRSGRALMSGFHGMFSVGAICGAGFVTLFISYGVAPRCDPLRHWRCHHRDPLGSIPLPFHQSDAPEPFRPKWHCKVACLLNRI